MIAEPMPVDAFKLYEWLSGTGFPAVLALILYTSYKGIWVWGSVYRKLEAEKNEWKTFALSGTQLASRAVSLATTSKAAASAEEAQR